MKLYYSNTSPYSRKVRMLLHIINIDKQIDKILVNPFIDAEKLRKINPIGKIPSLELDNGEVLYDSPVICRYLVHMTDEHMTSGQTIINPNDWAYYKILRWEALGDGLTDAAYNLVMEKRRSKDEQSNSCIDQWLTEIQNILNEIEDKIHDIGCEITLAHLSIASSLGYLEFRLPELLGNANHPNVLLWYADIKKQTFMKSTQPDE